MTNKPLSSLELFSGAGGLALGVAQAGFVHRGLIEWDRDACESLRTNRANVREMNDWDVHEGDVRHVSFRRFRDTVDLLSAGAPCQPFSIGGKHRGQEDQRNLFPEVFRAVREIRPRAVIVENVKGLLRQSFRPYLDYILRQLGDPELLPRSPADWQRHSHRLARENAANRLGYSVAFQLVNAADFGVAQRRQRVFIVALRNDLGATWQGIHPTHSEDSLVYDQFVSGTYWTDHRMARRTNAPRSLPKVRRLERAGRPEATERWLTVRDALAGLPSPGNRASSIDVANHVQNPGARAYPGHTGSPWDLPAKTLKAGAHGVPGGENMLRRDDGSVRYFTVREAARLQGFPDEYEFRGAWSEGFRQLGNAVPVPLGRAVASSVRKILLSGLQSRRIA